MSIELEDVYGSVPAVFEQQVDRHPEQWALYTSAHSLTYQQVDTAANRVANELLARRGDGAEPVPLVVADAALMLIAALGVLKAGKFYVPINPHFPLQRVGMLLREVSPAVLLCDNVGRTAAGAAYPGERLQVEDLLSGGSAGKRPAMRIAPDRFAYVLYTSGSTGRPKGIAQIHGNVLHNVLRHNALRVSANDRVTLLSADGFVGGVSNPYMALLNGASLASYSFRGEGVHGMLDWLERRRITVYYSFPSFFRQLVAVVSKTARKLDLRLLYLGGESVFPSDVAAARELFPGVTVAVGLNSTETGLTRLRLIPPHEEVPKEVLSVGGPVPYVEVRIVDDAGQRLADGCAGEVAVVSPYIRPVYWRPESSSDGPGEFSRDQEMRVFRTGDRGYISPQGELVHLGRLDSVVKVRGYRVELSEVESSLNAIAGVEEAVVVPHAPTPKESELVAYVVAREPGFDGRELRRRLAEVLPEAMLPSTFLFLDALPRTENGKVNRRDLPAPTRPTANADYIGNADYIAPRNALEEGVAKIWSSTLATPGVGASDNFFELGGHSILAVHIISAIRKEFGVAVPLRVLFETPTVAALASEIGRLQGSRAVEVGQ